MHGEMTGEDPWRIFHTLMGSSANMCTCDPIHLPEVLRVVEGLTRASSADTAKQNLQ